MSPAACSGSSRAITWRSDPAAASGAAAVRTTAVRNGHGACTNGVYICADDGVGQVGLLDVGGDADDLARRRCCCRPIFTRLPIGSSPGQYFAAIVSLMITTVRQRARRRAR